MIRILIVDDNHLMRHGLRALLAREPDLEVIGEARDGLEALDLARQTTPDLILLDLNMPGMGGLLAVEKLHGEAPRACILIVSMHADPHLASEAFKRGACGYVLKQDCFTELVPAIRTVAAGRTLFEPVPPGFCV